MMYQENETDKKIFISLCCDSVINRGRFTEHYLNITKAMREIGKSFGFITISIIMKNAGRAKV